MAANTVVRLGLIGSGRMARTRVANIAASPRAHLVAVTSHNVDTGAALASAQGCVFVTATDELLARGDLDAVIVATRNDSHGALTLDSLRAGKHTLVEYPLSLDAGQADEAVQEAERRRLALHVGYDQQWRGPHAAVRDLIDRDGSPLEAVVRVAWAGGARRSPFRHVDMGGAPALVKSYYLYALLDWLGHPRVARNAARYAGLDREGYYAAAVQHIALEYADTLARVDWIVGPDAGSRRTVDIALVWPAHSVTSDGQELTRRDASGEAPLPVAHAPWSEATRLGLEHFLGAVLDRPDSSPTTNAALAAAIVRLSTAPQRETM
jgi:predicted dehydrogenase